MSGNVRKTGCDRTTPHAIGVGIDLLAISTHDQIAIDHDSDFRSGRQRLVEKECGESLGLGHADGPGQPFTVGNGVKPLVCHRAGVYGLVKNVRWPRV